MYKIFHTDGTIFTGGKPTESNWEHILSKPIKRIEYTLSSKTLVMENFESYNHMFELAGLVFRGGRFLSKVMIMGKKGNKVWRYTFDYLKRTVSHKVVYFGKELRDRPTVGWKEGVKGLKPSIKVK